MTRTNTEPPLENHGAARKYREYFHGAGPLHLRGFDEVGEEDKDKYYNCDDNFFEENGVKGVVKIVNGVVLAVIPEE